MKYHDDYLKEGSVTHSYQKKGISGLTSTPVDLFPRGTRLTKKREIEGEIQYSPELMLHLFYIVT
jgi:hypothetical protein